MWMDLCDSFSPLVRFGVLRLVVNAPFSSHATHVDSPLHNNLHLRNDISETLMDFLVVVTCMLCPGLDLRLLLLRN
jgi:hypothetical protein